MNMKLKETEKTLERKMEDIKEKDFLLKSMYLY